MSLFILTNCKSRIYDYSLTGAKRSAKLQKKVHIIRIYGIFNEFCVRFL